jgi:hypothetical protein
MDVKASMNVYEYKERSGPKSWYRFHVRGERDIDVHCMVALRERGFRHISARVEYLYNKITRTQEYLPKAIEIHVIAVQIHTACDECMSMKSDGIQGVLP